MQTSTPHSPKKVRRVFFYLLLLFIVPLLLASWMAFQHKSVPAHTTNHGQLLQPPLDIAQLKLAGDPAAWKKHWLLLYVSPTECEKDCEKTLYNIRQIRTATGKDADRVQRAILTFSDAPIDVGLSEMLKTEFKGTSHLTTLRKDFKRFIQETPSKEIALKQGGIYVVDPLGNIMMFYSLETEPMGIFKDLTRLLKLSHIG